MMFSGWFDLPWWGLILTALALTHVTIAAVTIFLHRCQAHRALELHPLVSHFFRFWLWLTTGMVTKEWAAIHRKHHAKCETADDPHSPQVHGINRVLWLGVFLYVKESYNKETTERYGHGTPDDWIEHNLYSRFATTGVVLLLATDMFLFGVVPGALIWATQIAWIPFWAAGVIIGVGHFFGYSNYDDVPDASKNIVPCGILIGGGIWLSLARRPATARPRGALSWAAVRLRQPLDPGTCATSKVDEPFSSATTREPITDVTLGR